VPIVEADGRLVGIVTQSDVVAALSRASIAPAPAAT
jgi:CBS-domain-containing membrane protein